jgi:hypothetical protein
MSTVSTVHVQLTDDGSAIAAVFGCPQDPEVYPNQAELQEDDARYLAFVAGPWREIALAQVRAVREVTLNRLAGIGFAAQASGDAEALNGALKARQALLDITKATPVQAATDQIALKAALKAVYTEIAAAAPVAVRAAFAEIDL